MQIFLWQIATVIPIKGTRTSVNMPGFQTLILVPLICPVHCEDMFERSRIRILSGIVHSLGAKIACVRCYGVFDAISSLERLGKE